MNAEQHALQQGASTAVIRACGRYDFCFERLGEGTRYFKYRNDPKFHDTVQWLVLALRSGVTCRLDLPDCCNLAIEIYEEELLHGRQNPNRSET